MAGGEFLKLARPGDDPLDHYTAAAFNEFAANANERRFRRENRHADPLDYSENPNIVDIQNNSGASRDQYDILALNGVAFTPTANLAGFQAAPMLLGTLPTLADTGRFAILLDPVGTSTANKYGRAAIAGGWVAKIQVDHEQHPYADIANGSARLTSNWYGAAKIMYQESGTGVKWAFVKLVDLFRGPIAVIITQSGGIAPGSSGTAKVRWAGADASPTSTITVYYDWMEGASNAGQNKEAIVFWVPDRQKFVIHELQC